MQTEELKRKTGGKASNKKTFFPFINIFHSHGLFLSICCSAGHMDG
jgi:hypothetical protein